jgi:hypothetical protein
MGGGGHISPVVPEIDKKNFQNHAIVKVSLFQCQRAFCIQKLLKFKDIHTGVRTQLGKVVIWPVLLKCAFGIFSTCVIVGIFAFNLCDQIIYFYSVSLGTLHFTVPQVFDGVCSDGFYILLLACFDGVCIQWLVRYGKM